MRCDQYIGLNEWASTRVFRTHKVHEIGVRILPSGKVRKFDRWIRVPVARTQVIGRIEGAWNDNVANLNRYTLPDGTVYEEFIQATPWSSGPCYFIALKDKHGKPVAESLWNDEEIANA